MNFSNYTIVRYKLFCLVVDTSTLLGQLLLISIDWYYIKVAFTHATLLHIWNRNHCSLKGWPNIPSGMYSCHRITACYKHWNRVMGIDIKNIWTQLRKVMLIQFVCSRPPILWLCISLLTTKSSCSQHKVSFCYLQMVNYFGYSSQLLFVCQRNMSLKKVWFSCNCDYNTSTTYNCALC